jgi:hypothetical protein
LNRKIEFNDIFGTYKRDKYHSLLKELIKEFFTETTVSKNKKTSLNFSSHNSLREDVLNKRILRIFHNAVKMMLYEQMEKFRMKKCKIKVEEYFAALNMTVREMIRGDSSGVIQTVYGVEKIEDKDI